MLLNLTTQLLLKFSLRHDRPPMFQKLSTKRLITNKRPPPRRPPRSRPLRLKQQAKQLQHRCVCQYARTKDAPRVDTARRLLQTSLQLHSHLDVITTQHEENLEAREARCSRDQPVSLSSSKPKPPDATSDRITLDF